MVGRTEEQRLIWERWLEVWDGTRKGMKGVTHGAKRRDAAQEPELPFEYPILGNNRSLFNLGNGARWKRPRNIW